MRLKDFMPLRSWAVNFLGVLVCVSYDFFLLSFFSVPLINDAKGYLDIGFLYYNFFVNPSLENLSNIGMVREPVLPFILGLLAIIKQDHNFVVIANMLLAHLLFVYTVMKLASLIPLSGGYKIFTFLRIKDL